MNKAVQNSPFAVLCAPFVHADRRALSQAWYSALHLQTKEQRDPRKVSQVRNPCDLHSNVRVRIEQRSEGWARTSAASSRIIAKAQIRQTAGCERRASRSTLARKIERLLVAPQTGSHSATLALDGDHGRVHIVVRAQGSQVRIIAVCAPKARQIVQAALMQARYALARTGVALDATLQSAAS
ncbi:MAG: hypothetical protein GIW98_02610 [Candidatus Eremiobacteraeota bacterium]|nr:hypothetical protein [Candidatus Eremiobacteraeota bacterium]